MSKTHTLANYPQIVKIASVDGNGNKFAKRNKYCPYLTLKRYLELRKQLTTKNKQVFVFADGTPVRPGHLSRVLKLAVKLCRLNPNLYHSHSLRIGKATDLAKNNMSTDLIKHIGHWKSNSVYKYIRYTN